MELREIIRISKDVVARDMGGELVLLDLESGQYFGLDRVGGKVWEIVSEKQRSLENVCELLAAEFDAPRAQIESDLRALVQQLQEQGLVTLEPA